jgi:hypothetical protein
MLIGSGTGQEPVPHLKTVIYFVTLNILDVLGPGTTFGKGIRKQKKDLKRKNLT